MHIFMSVWKNECLLFSVIKVSRTILQFHGAPDERFTPLRPWKQIHLLQVRKKSSSFSMVGLDHLLFSCFVDLMLDQSSYRRSARIKQTILLYSQQQSDLIEGGKLPNPLQKDRRKVKVFLQVRPSK